MGNISSIQKQKFIVLAVVGIVALLTLLGKLDRVSGIFGRAEGKYDEGGGGGVAAVGDDEDRQRTASNNDGTEDELLNKAIREMYADSRKSPIVIERYKLLFFNVPKVASTFFKLLFHEIQGIDTAYLGEPRVPWSELHNPKKNKLTYLHDILTKEENDDADGNGITYVYKNDTSISALDILKSNDWTKAIFVRDPHERLLSAYLNKGVDRNFSVVRRSCCPNHNRKKKWNDKIKIMNVSGGSDTCMPKGQQDFSDFVDLLELSNTTWGPCLYKNQHWAPQSRRIWPAVWPYVNFVGHMKTFERDTKALIDRIGYEEEKPNDNGKEDVDHTAAASAPTTTGEDTVADVSDSGGVGGDEGGQHQEEKPKDNGKENNDHAAAAPAPTTSDSGGQHHFTGSKQKKDSYYNSQELIDRVTEMYKEDFDNPYLGFQK